MGIRGFGGWPYKIKSLFFSLIPVVFDLWGTVKILCDEFSRVFVSGIHDFSLMFAPASDSW